MVSIRLRLTYCKQNWTTGSREGSILSNKPIFVIFEKKKLYFSVGSIVIVGGGPLRREHVVLGWHYQLDYPPPNGVI